MKKSGAFIDRKKNIEKTARVICKPTLEKEYICNELTVYARCAVPFF